MSREIPYVRVKTLSGVGVWEAPTAEPEERRTHVALKGWLANPVRRRRRERAFTLTDRNVMDLIERIWLVKRYAQVDDESERLLRMRDSALIALAWTFFKRANEVLRLRVSDVFWDDRLLYATFRVSKKSRRRRICPNCSHENGVRAKRCSMCGFNIAGVEPVTTGKSETVVTKTKSLEYPFTKYVVDWVQQLRQLGAKAESWLFPRFNVYTGRFELEGGGSGLTVRRFNQILQRLDPALSTHMFRYGATEKYLRLGYTPYELAEIGDWSSSAMPELYAKRKGLTPTLKRFGEDVRTL